MYQSTRVVILIQNMYHVLGKEVRKEAEFIDNRQPDAGLYY